MERIFAIPCKYSDDNPFIYNCIDSIRKYHNDKIVVVDSDSDDKSYLDVIKDRYSNVDVLDIKNNNFMTGTIWETYKKYKVNYYYFLHDSTEILGSLLDYEKYDIVPILKSSDWEWPEWNGKRTSKWARNEIKKTPFEFKEDGFDVVIGPMFIIKNEILYKLQKLNFDKILPTNKSEMEMMERLWGLAFDSLGFKFSYNVDLRNRSGAVKPIGTKTLKNYKNNKDIDVIVKLGKKYKNDLIIKYWSGRK